MLYILPFFPLPTALWNIFKSTSLFAHPRLTFPLCYGDNNIALLISHSGYQAADSLSCTHSSSPPAPPAGEGGWNIILVSSRHSLRDRCLQGRLLMPYRVEHVEIWAEPGLLMRTSLFSRVFLPQLRGENEISPDSNSSCIHNCSSFSPRLIFKHPSLFLKRWPTCQCSATRITPPPPILNKGLPKWLPMCSF